jgi:acetyl-CoA acetyltransferase
MRRVVVLGGGHSKFCYNSPKTSVEMLSEVAIDAIRESNLSVKDIQAVNVGNVLGDFSEGQEQKITVARILSLSRICLKAVLRCIFHLCLLQELISLSQRGLRDITRSILLSAEW